PTFRSLVDADIPAAIARDSEVSAAITAHEGAADPHTGYQKEPLGCRLSNSINQSIPFSTLTALTFDSEIYDIGGLHDAGNPSRITFPQTGWASVSGTMEWVAPTTTCFTLVALLLNGGADAIAGESKVIFTASGFLSSVHATFRVTAGDYAEIFVLHTHPISLDSSAAGAFPAFIAALWPD
ncbi:MAG: hypothetical protein ACREYE_30090, partial [Gammaproteobacteria bacterium]